MPSEHSSARAKKEELMDKICLFGGLARTRKEGRLEECLPAWTKKTKAKIWNQVSEDRAARNDFMSTDFLRHMIGEAEEKGAMTLTHVCANSKAINFLRPCLRVRPPPFPSTLPPSSSS